MKAKKINGKTNAGKPMSKKEMKKTKGGVVDYYLGFGVKK